MKHIDGPLLQSPRGLLLGFLFGAMTLTGCDSGTTGGDKPPPAPAPVVAPSTSKPADGKSKGDTSSRRERQKEKAGQSK
jgi:hypothetical protein